MVEGKSVIRDLRDLVQDVVTPDIRSLKVEVQGINARLDRLEKNVTDGFAEMRRMLDVHADVQAVKERLARIEEREVRPSA